MLAAVQPQPIENTFTDAVVVKLWLTRLTNVGGAVPTIGACAIVNTARPAITNASTMDRSTRMRMSSSVSPARIATVAYVLFCQIGAAGAPH